MKKNVLRSVTAMLLLVLLFKPSATQAQAYCPMHIYNNAQSIGLGVATSVFNDFVNGTYYLTMISSQRPDCIFFVDQPVDVSKVSALNTVIPTASGGPGLVLSFASPLCNGNMVDNELQIGALSIILKKATGEEFLKLNFFDNELDECEYIAFPVTFGSFTGNSLDNPKRVKLNWNTYTEADMGYFSVEKSSDGATYYKIGQVTATNNPNGSSYEFYDYSPVYRGYYRIVSIDNNCYKQYSKIVFTTCSTCPTTFTPPSTTPDCNVSGPSPYISGPASICDNSRQIYRLNDFTGEAQVTWSIAPTGVATITQVGRMAAITPTGAPAAATLTATVVKNGVTTTYSKAITFGIPYIPVSHNKSSPAPCTGNVTYTATVYPLSGTSGYNYKWYQNGSFLGTGLSRSWTLSPNQVIYYQIKYDGPCGQSVYNGSSGGGAIEVRKAPTYTVSVNPGQSDITLLKPACPPPPPEPRIATSRPVQLFKERSVDIKVYDMYGNFRKSARMSSAATRFTINARGLSTGLYYVHITEPGTEPVKLKVWVQK